jgi:hypothetical protein
MSSFLARRMDNTPVLLSSFAKPGQYVPLGLLNPPDA